MIQRVLAATAAVMMAGSAMAANLPTDKLGAFKTGQSSKAQVLASLGEPRLRNNNPDGRSVLLYVYDLPETEKDKPTREVVVTFLFDKQDTLLETRLYARSAQGATGAADPAAGAATGGIEDENLLTPQVKGFKIGSRSNANRITQTEWVPEGETVQNWSRMVTVQIFHGLTNATPDAFADGMKTGWAASCKGADFETLGGDPDNGYPSSIRRFSCPLNPQTGKPENTYMKFVRGADAFYVVQYAYRSALTPESTTQAVDYLKSTTVCDSRKTEHPCPQLTPVAR